MNYYISTYYIQSILKSKGEFSCATMVLYTLRINEILAEKGISKNKICKDLDIPRSNFNRYCRDEFQRMDINLICKLCDYLDVDISVLIEYRKPDRTTPE